MVDYQGINEAIQNGELSSFNKLNEDEKVQNMKTWTEEMWCKYYTQETFSDKEVFDEIYKIIDDADK